MSDASPDRSGWSAVASQFYDHWDSLRDNAPAPASEVFLDNPNVALQPFVFILEMTERNKTHFRLMATELVKIWGADFTGRAVEEVFSPDVAARYLASPRQCVTTVCGLWEKGLFGNISGREVKLELIYLPLTVSAGKPNRLAGVLAETETTTKTAVRRGIIAIEGRRWLDIGQGIPNQDPNIFSVG
ncbi:MAG: PAS domain-containing protein [Alphaproteobacteria bacterium]|nr:PAS domain-containing protein [Alphaproteobacteria bacterium]